MIALTFNPQPSHYADYTTSDRITSTMAVLTKGFFGHRLENFMKFYTRSFTKVCSHTLQNVIKTVEKKGENRMNSMLHYCC
jgi:hypothetical protein